MHEPPKPCQSDIETTSPSYSDSDFEGLSQEYNNQEHEYYEKGYPEWYLKGYHAGQTFGELVAEKNISSLSSSDTLALQDGPQVSG